jgi:hypothetical protein
MLRLFGGSVTRWIDDYCVAHSAWQIRLVVGASYVAWRQVV